MFNFRQITILLQLLFLSHAALGQLSYSFRKYTVDDGLPSSNLYDIQEDAKGFIWIATEAGICRFDGKRFEKEPIPKLGNAEITKLFVDGQGRMWFSDLAENLLLYENDSLKNISNYPSLEGKGFTIIKEDRHGDYWLSNELGENIGYLNGNTLQDTSTLFYQSEKFKGDKAFISINDSLHIFLSSHGVNTFRDNRLEYKSYPKGFRFRTAPHSAVKINDTIVVATLERLYAFSRRKGSLQPIFSKYNRMFEGGITQLMVDKENNLWVGTKDGVVLFDQENRNKPQRYLNNRFISGIIEDHEGGYWFATQKDGLFYLPSLQIKTYQNQRLVNPQAICVDSLGRTLIGSENYYLNALDKNYRSQRLWKVANKEGEVFDIIKDSEEHFYILHSNGLQKINDRFNLVYREEGDYLTGQLLNDQELYFGAANQAGIFNTQEKEAQALMDTRTFSILPLSNEDIWIGTISGLYHYKNPLSPSPQLNIELSKEVPLQQDIRDIQISPDTTLWIATQADGLILYKNEKIIKHFTTKDGLVSNNCKKILIDTSHAWIGTNKGIHRFNLNDLSFITISKDHGLPSNEINDFAKNGNTLLAATNDGVAIFDESLNIYSDPPNVHFTKVSFKDIESRIKPAYDISYQENDINIEFSAIAYHQPNELEYQYMMEPVTENWIQTNANLAQFQALTAGDYNFKVRARTRNSLWSPEQSLQFKISSPFWKQSWFLILTIGLGLFLLYRVFAWIYNDIRERKEVKDKLQASQMTALRAQMNPHFLFNSLNSIQEFIMTQDRREANRYLTRFSRLMRNILNMSEMEEVALKQEIETLDLYLSLEALRLETNFEYHIETDKSINTESMTIPPMLVQPYVENAVKHGLMHKKNSMRHLWVRFYVKNKMLVCEIEDNGIGRAKAKAIQENNKRIYASKGMQMTKQRLALLNRAYDNTLDVNVNDLVDPSGVALGTKVTLYVSLDDE